MFTRKQQAKQIRNNAADLAVYRPHPRHRSNGEELEYRRSQPDPHNPHKLINQPSYIANFTKGLPHDEQGLLYNPRDYQQFVRAIDSGDPRDFLPIPLGPGKFNPDGSYKDYDLSDPNNPKPIHQWSSGACSTPKVRAWESQGAGNTFDLEGPDAQALTMPSAPRLDSQELIAEMAEVYWMAALRDRPFADFATDTEVQTAQQSLAQFAWFDASSTNQLTPSDLTPEALYRRRVLVQSAADTVPLNQLFRGVTTGDDVGPYISQFLLIGNRSLGKAECCFDQTQGRIAYGSITIDQQVRVAKQQDFMIDWGNWLDVQNGADVTRTEEYECRENHYHKTPLYRFITTGRDLATYVHYDALYEAYLNAGLILLGMNAPFDPGIPFQDADFRDKQQGFAQFGGPHILTLVTEVATRALKAVRFQKFNVHRRLRPEAVGGLLYQWDKNQLPEVAVIEKLYDEIAGSELETAIRDISNDGLLLPMAFPEGSPMHPAYGAGHATVAGACVTILKAFFDHGWQLQFKDSDNDYIAYESDSSCNGEKLREVKLEHNQPLTVEGELNKLASNISIGRNWAGVHYFSDYLESIRLGEQIAIAILEEQKLTYGENFSMTVPLFDGGAIRI